MLIVYLVFSGQNFSLISFAAALRDVTQPFKVLRDIPKKFCYLGERTQLFRL